MMPEPRLTGDLQYRVKHLDTARYHGGPRAHPPTLVVWHATAGESAQSSIDYLNSGEKFASYHYVIDRDGTILRALNPDFVAWHAGDSAWPTRNAGPHQGTSINPESIGIAFANRNDGEVLTQRQVESALYLARFAWQKYRIGAQGHVAHRDVSPQRKTDPLPEVFDLQWFRGAVVDVIAAVGAGA